MLRKILRPKRALAALRQHAEVVIHPGDQVLDADALAKAARGCDIIVSDRQTPGPAAFFAQVPDSVVAFLRVAVDIRNIDVPAASEAGVLVTRATPGFMASVAEMTIGFMVDLGRSVSPTSSSHTGRAARPKRARVRQLTGSTLGIIGYGRSGSIWRRWRRLGIL